MADDEEPTFEGADGGASDVYPTQAGEIRKGSHIMIKGHPCKVAELSTSKTGKHGHAKAHIVALDIFTSKKYEDLCPTSHNVEVPFVKRTEYQCLSADPNTGEVSLLTESGQKTCQKPRGSCGEGRKDHYGDSAGRMWHGENR